MMFKWNFFFFFFFFSVKRLFLIFEKCFSFINIINYFFEFELLRIHSLSRLFSALSDFNRSLLKITNRFLLLLFSIKNFDKFRLALCQRQ
jgi:hypothetical protein